MELRSLTPDMPALLAEMGARYDPQRLAAVLADREVEIAARAVQVATQLGGCVAAVAKVGRCAWRALLVHAARPRRHPDACMPAWKQEMSKY